jgi:hypothetical protein
MMACGFLHAHCQSTLTHVLKVVGQAERLVIVELQQAHRVEFALAQYWKGRQVDQEILAAVTREDPVDC